MDPLARFAAIVRVPDEASIPLDEAALLIAAGARPTVDVHEWLRRLDEVAAAVGPGDRDGWRRRLYLELGFSGNALDYYDPRNSLLDEVLTRRTGIPISLAVVGIEVARRTGVPLVGVGMPGHFLVRHRDDPNTFVDPFDGVVLDRDGCRRLFVRIAGTDTAFDDDFLAPVGPRAILSRMLANLKAIHARRGDVFSLASVLQFRLAIPGTPESERVELSRALAAGGRWDLAADELLRAAECVPHRAEQFERDATRLRARLN